MYLTDPTIQITDPVKTGIVKTLWDIRTLAESTQKGYAKCLKILSTKADLNDPLNTEKYILALDVTNKYKNNLFSAYQKYCISNGIQWSRPKNLRNETYPIKIPTEERINNIISSATPKYAVVYTLSKYGLRPVARARSDKRFERQSQLSSFLVFPPIISPGEAQVL